MAKLGKLEKIELRDVWKNEETDFTPWLAEDDNIKLLGDTIGIELEVETREKEVGAFKADILCKDTSNNSWVIVENQLEKTDHGHLGQTITYAAGLEAITTIWIAERFREEHRAALDWLNEITDERFSFFGLEMELWRIGESDVAPKFNVVCKPNDWSKSVKATAEKRELSKTESVLLDYWSAFTDLMQQSGVSMNVPKAAPQHWLTFSIGRTGFQIFTRASNRGQQVGAYLNISGSNRLMYYDMMQDKYQSQVDDIFGSELEWRRLPEKKESHIELYFGCDPSDQSDWPRQHTWLLDKVKKLHHVLAPIIKQLDISEYVETDSDEESGD